MPDNKQRKVKVGTKLAAEKIRVEEHESGQQAAAVTDRDKANINVITNTKA